MRSIEEVSADGMRKVVITELGNNESELCFFRNDFCYLNIKVPENVLALASSCLDNKNYMIYANKFLEEDFGNDSLNHINDVINKDINSKYSLTFHFSNALQSIEYDKPSFKLDFGERIIESYAYFPFLLNSRSLLGLSKMSIDLLYQLSFGWQVVDLVLFDSEDYKGYELECFTYNNIEFVGYHNVLMRFNTIQYLKGVDYANTGNLFKDNVFTENDKVFFSKIITLKQKILILWIEKDFSFIYKII